MEENQPVEGWRAWLQRTSFLLFRWLKQTDSWINRLTVGLTDGLADGLTDGQADEHIEKQTNTPT